MTMKFDNKLISLSRRYADGLFSVAQSKNQVDAAFEDLKTVLSAIMTNDDMANFLIHPVVSIEDKKDALTSIFKDKVSESVFNLLFLLVENNRFNLFQPILVCYEKNMDDLKNIDRASVTSAVELDDDVKKRLQAKLEAKFNKKMILNYDIDADILAGLIIKIGDKVIDSSLASKFENMKKQLI